MLQNRLCRWHLSITCAGLQCSLLWFHKEAPRKNSKRTYKEDFHSARSGRLTFAAGKASPPNPLSKNGEGELHHRNS